jgi:hypothetical protein
MEGLIFTPDRNSHGKRDYTGAFRPMAKKFAKHHKLSDRYIIKIDVSKPMKKRRQQVLDAITKHQEEVGSLLDSVSFFCHGYPRGIQCGFSWRGKVTAGEALDPLAAAIYESSDRTDICVPLYCCSTASARQKNAPGGDGGFADELRDALCRQGATENRVVGHTTVGHTTNNPYVRFFDGSLMPAGGTGGYWIARPGGPLWRKWAKFLRAGGWMDMPFMDLPEIRTKLQ